SLVHKACLELDITHMESLCNLEALVGQGEFRFIGLPLKWRGGTGSPIRAVAVVEEESIAPPSLVAEIQRLAASEGQSPRRLRIQRRGQASQRVFGPILRRAPPPSAH